MKRFLFVSVIILSLCNYVFAAPSKPSVSGTIANGQQITITGTSFGSTGPTIQFFDDLETGTASQDIGDGETEAAQIGTWADVSATNDYYLSYSTAQSHSGTKSALADFSRASDCGTGSPWGEPVLDLSAKYYIQFWTYLPSGEAVPGTTSCGPSPNWKVWWLTTDGVHKNDFASEIITDPPTETSICYVDGTTNRACWGYGAFSFTKGTWLRWEIYLTASTSAGVANLWFMDSSQARNLVGYDTGRTVDDGSTGWQHIHFAGYGRLDSNSHIYYDDFYISTGDGALARVEIGNASTYSACTNIAVATIDSWSDTSITATVRSGSFVDESVYLYVVDSSGNISPASDVMLYGSGVQSTPTITGLSVQ